jgi:hypothetical protein
MLSVILQIDFKSLGDGHFSVNSGFGASCFWKLNSCSTVGFAGGNGSEIWLDEASLRWPLPAGRHCAPLVSGTAGINVAGDFGSGDVKGSTLGDGFRPSKEELSAVCAATRSSESLGTIRAVRTTPRSASS